MLIHCLIMNLDFVGALGATGTSNFKNAKADK